MQQGSHFSSCDCLPIASVHDVVSMTMISVTDQSGGGGGEPDAHPSASPYFTVPNFFYKCVFVHLGDSYACLTSLVFIDCVPCLMRQKYSGMYFKDRRHGQGEYSWPDGTAYTGLFYMEKKEGYGTFNFPDGCVFKVIIVFQSRVILFHQV